MTDQEINIAIAEACEWECIREQITSTYGFKAESEFVGLKKGANNFALIPNYAYDLNAMHEAVNSVDTRSTYWNNGMFPELYIRQLQRVVRGVDGCFDQYNATARQRAEAFLRTIGKWRDA